MADMNQYVDPLKEDHTARNLALGVAGGAILGAGPVKKMAGRMWEGAGMPGKGAVDVSRAVFDATGGRRLQQGLQEVKNFGAELAEAGEIGGLIRAANFKPVNAEVLGQRGVEWGSGIAEALHPVEKKWFGLATNPRTAEQLKNMQRIKDRVRKATERIGGRAINNPSNIGKYTMNEEQEALYNAFATANANITPVEHHIARKYMSELSKDKIHITPEQAYGLAANLVRAMS